MPLIKFARETIDKMVRLAAFIRRHRQSAYGLWVIVTVWFLYVTFFHVPLVAFVPMCNGEDGQLEPVSKSIDQVLDTAFEIELRMYFSPFKEVSGDTVWDSTGQYRRYLYTPSTYFITPWDALDLRGQTSHATISAAYSIWYGLSDKDRINAPEPGNSDLIECEAIRRFALKDAPRTWDQCIYSCGWH